MAHEINYLDIIKEPKISHLLASDSSSVKKLFVVTDVITNKVAYMVTIGFPDNTEYHTFVYPLILMAVNKYNEIGK